MSKQKAKQPVLRSVVSARAGIPDETPKKTATINPRVKSRTSNWNVAWDDFKKLSAPVLHKQIEIQPSSFQEIKINDQSFVPKENKENKDHDSQVLQEIIRGTRDLSVDVVDTLKTKPDEDLLKTKINDSTDTKTLVTDQEKGKENKKESEPFVDSKEQDTNNKKEEQQQKQISQLITTNSPSLWACPHHCGNIWNIEPADMHCKIFRCGNIRENGIQRMADPHMPEQQWKDYKEKGMIVNGCGKPFEFDDKTQQMIICDWK